MGETDHVQTDLELYRNVDFLLEIIFLPTI